MTGRRWVVAVVLVVGCRGPQFYEPPGEQLPPPANHGGTEVVLEDRRPEWERKPFTGAASLYHPGKVRPSPWDQLAAEAAAVAAELPARPHRVTVAVTSLRLVKTDEARVRNQLVSSRFTLVPGVSWFWLLERPEDLYPKAVVEHPDGASCAIEAEVTLEGPMFAQKVAVKTLTTGPGVADPASPGNVFDYPVRAAVVQVGRQIRSAVGLPDR